MKITAIEYNRIEANYDVELDSKLIFTIGDVSDLFVGDEVLLSLKKPTDPGGVEHPVREGGVASSPEKREDRFVRPSNGKAGWHI